MTHHLSIERFSLYRFRIFWWVLLSFLIANGYGFTTSTRMKKTLSPSEKPLFFYDRYRSGSIMRNTLFASTSSSSLPEIESMRASEMRKELESYGISTKSFFEKNEFAEALRKARLEGKKPITKTSSGDAQTKANTEKKATSASTDQKSREKRIAEELEKCNKMKASELKQELKNLGISTKSFFEKSEFAKALAEARVDGVTKKASSAGQEEEDYDPSYRDVVMQKFTANQRDPRSLGPVIDIKLKR